MKTEKGGVSRRMIEKEEQVRGEGGREVEWEIEGNGRKRSEKGNRSRREKRESG